MWYRGIAQCGKVHAFQLARSTLGQGPNPPKKSNFFTKIGVDATIFLAFSPICPFWGSLSIVVCELFLVFLSAIRILPYLCIRKRENSLRLSK